MLLVVNYLLVKPACILTIDYYVSMIDMMRVNFECVE